MVLSEIDRTTVQGLQSGTIDGGMLMSGVIADYGCEELGVFTLPYLFDLCCTCKSFWERVMPEKRY